MKLRIMSDIHLEFGKFKIPLLETDKDTILIIAGDLGTGKMARPWLERYSKNFRKVIYIMGNHEFYHNDFNKLREFWNTIKIENATVLDNSVIEIDDKIFFGATLWTNFNNGNHCAMITVNRGMNDFCLIKQDRSFEKHGSYCKKFTTEDAYEEHKKTIKALELATYHNKDMIVITHHLPTFQSVPPMYVGRTLNHGYASHLDELIMTINPKLWIHGHTHDGSDYMIEKTRIICNPRGYVGYERSNTIFDPKFLIEI